MTDPRDLERELARAIEHHERHGALPESLPADVAALAARYLDLTMLLDAGPAADDGMRPADSIAPSPGAPVSLTGFRTIERLGAGGMGEVYKLHDIQLDRIVAAKIVRRDRIGRLSASPDAFLREARALALFSDPRIVQIYECRLDSDPAVILMEFVDGFELGRLGPSLEFRQRAKVIREVADAVHRAHGLGIQHRDLKPANIVLDAALRPRILDFGLSDSDPTRGHLRGTVQYIAPEQLDPSQPIDARTDVYALGVILYELLCGAAPFQGETTDILAAVRNGAPRLPREIDPAVPAPLQAIALKAMERRPADRYQSAADLVRDLDRYLAGQPVLARPTLYATTLESRVRPHLDQIGEWLRLKLIYPHEADRLTSAYTALEAREDDWIVASRVLSYSQIALYLGAFFLFAGGLFYFVAHRVHESVAGITGPALVLGLPFVGLNLAGRRLYEREHKAVAVAFFLAGVTLLPLALLIALHEMQVWMAPDGSTTQLFTDGWISNRQLQFAVAAATAWSGWLAIRTSTAALSALATVLVFVLAIALLADLGLRDWIENETFDRLAVRLLPLVALYAIGAWLLERGGRAWFSQPGFVAAALTLVLALDLLALDGRLFHYLGISLDLLQPADVENPTLLPTLAALSLNGTLFYGVALAFEKYGSSAMRPATALLVAIAPFSLLEPLAFLSETGIYSTRFDWLYLGLAVSVAVLSHQRQRKSFYYAGLLNSGVALYLIAARNDWFDRPLWAIALVVIGLGALAAGFLLDARRRRNQTR
jgi:serine/threonine protein kinase